MLGDAGPRLTPSVPWQPTQLPASTDTGTPCAAALPAHATPASSSAAPNAFFLIASPPPLLPRYTGAAAASAEVAALNCRPRFAVAPLGAFGVGGPGSLVHQPLVAFDAGTPLFPCRTTRALADWKR